MRTGMLEFSVQTLRGTLQSCQESDQKRSVTLCRSDLFHVSVPNANSLAEYESSRYSKETIEEVLCEVHDGTPPYTPDAIDKEASNEGRRYTSICYHRKAEKNVRRGSWLPGSNATR